MLFMRTWPATNARTENATSATCSQRRASRVALAIVALPWPAPSPAWAKPHLARVTFVTKGHAFLNAGQADGLRLGDTVSLARGGRKQSCKVDALSAKHARCAAEGSLINATVVLPRQQAASKKAASLAAPPTREDIASATRAFRSTAFPKVTFQGSHVDAEHAPPQALQAWISANHNAWTILGNGGSTRQHERVDLFVAAHPLHTLRDVRFASRLSVLAWTQQAVLNRFRPNTNTQLYVWETDVVSRGVDNRLSFAVGRILPWGVPGVALQPEIGWDRRKR